MWQLSCRNAEPHRLRQPPDHAVVLLEALRRRSIQTGTTFPSFRGGLHVSSTADEKFVHPIVERTETPFDGRIVVEEADAVVVEIRGRRPDRDEAGRPVVSTASPRQRHRFRAVCKGIPDR